MASLFISRFSVAPESRDEFLKRFGELYQMSKPILDQETTVLFYGWSRSGQYVAVESYRDEGRLNEMRDTDGFKAGFAGLMQCCDGPMTLELFSGVDMDAPSTAHDKALFDELYPLGESRFHPEVDGKPTLIV